MVFCCTNVNLLVSLTDFEIWCTEMSLGALLFLLFPSFAHGFGLVSLLSFDAFLLDTQVSLSVTTVQQVYIYSLYSGFLRQAENQETASG